MMNQQIKRKFDALNKRYNNPVNRGWKQYDIMQEMQRLSQLHYQATGQYLRRVKS